MNGRRVVTAGAGVALAGVVLSGPASLWLVAATHPQPPWSGPAAFVAAYHPVQAVPYFFGFLLVGGFAVLLAGLHDVAPDEVHGRTAAALVFAGAFAAMIFTNYAIQTSVVPALVTSGAGTDRSLLAWLTMANPLSLGWSLEMWGYAVLGVATWLAAPAFGGEGIERPTAALFVANGPISLAGGVMTALAPGWVLTTGGLVAFGAWNLLVVAMTACAIAAMRARGRADAPEAELRHGTEGIE